MSAGEIEALNTMSSLHNSLQMVKNLRVSLYSLFDDLNNGPDDNQESTVNFLRGVQQKLITMDSAFSDLEKSGNSLPKVNPPAINSSALAYEPENENFKVFQQLVESYSWVKRMEEYSAQVASHLKENQLKRGGQSAAYAAVKRNRKYLPHAAPPQDIERMATDIGHTVQQKLGDPHFKMQVKHTNSSNCAIVISVSPVFKALLFMRGLIIERVIIKSETEEISSSDNGQVDPFSESKYKVFRMITQTAQAALLHYQSSTQSIGETILYQYAMYIHSYHNLYFSQCDYCGKILKDGIPPTCRTFSKPTQKYHVQCSTSSLR